MPVFHQAVTELIITSFGLLQVDISCHGRLPVELKYRVVGTTDTDQSFTCPMSSIQPDGSLECSISDNVLIDANSKYSVEVTAENEVGRSLPAVRNFSKELASEPKCRMHPLPIKCRPFPKKDWILEATDRSFILCFHFCNIVQVLLTFRQQSLLLHLILVQLR